MLNRSASLAMSTSVLKALPGKLDIKRHSPSILYISCVLFASNGSPIQNLVVVHTNKKHMKHGGFSKCKIKWLSGNYNTLCDGLSFFKS